MLHWCPGALLTQTSPIYVILPSLWRLGCLPRMDPTISRMFVCPLPLTTFWGVNPSELAEQKLLFMGKNINLYLINKWDLLELRHFCKTRTWSIRQNSSLQIGKRVINPTLNRELISKIYKELKKLHNKRTNNLIFKKMGYRPKQRLSTGNFKGLKDT